MARYTGPKHRLARLEGVNILEKTSASLERRLNLIPGIHGKKGRRKVSEYGLQLREKQKLKKIYGLLEKQFRKYVELAQKKKTNTEDALVELLETRLDNVVYRMGFAKSRFQARQFVSHKHILVNGKKVNIPSYQVEEGDVVTLDPKIARLQEEKEEYQTLSYIARKKDSGKLVSLPNREEVANPVDYQLVIEFYSR
ncbi:MAG: 30S ribosomal protein S4 [Candidatus Levyibacteriota bacterium]